MLTKTQYDFSKGLQWNRSIRTLDIESEKLRRNTDCQEQTILKKKKMTLKAEILVKL